VARRFTIPGADVGLHPFELRRLQSNGIRSSAPDPGDAESSSAGRAGEGICCSKNFSVPTALSGKSVSTVVVPNQSRQISIAPTPPVFRLGYRPALDGIRAVAILLVLGFHSGLRFLPGGSLGVDIFFVLSGFLITCLLAQEWQENGRIGLK